MQRRSLILQAAALMVLLSASTSAEAQELGVSVRARGYEPLIAAAAAKHGVDPRLLWTIAYLESRFRPEAISRKDGKPCAYGMMQFVPTTAARYGLVNPHDPAQAIHAAARYVRDLTRRFNGDRRLVLAAYNSGEGTVEAYRSGRRLVLPTGKIINAAQVKTDGVPPYRETQGYVAGGTAIYRNISATGIFLRTPRKTSARALVAAHLSSLPPPPPPLPPVVQLAPEEVPERSVYMTTSPTVPAMAIESKKLPPPPTVSSTAAPTNAAAAQTKRTRSIYIR